MNKLPDNAQNLSGIIIFFKKLVISYLLIYNIIIKLFKDYTPFKRLWTSLLVPRLLSVLMNATDITGYFFNIDTLKKTIRLLQIIPDE